MPRCIVLIGGHELLRDGWRKRSFAPAGSLLDSRVKVAGVRFDETYHPVRVLRRIGGGDDPPAATGFNYSAVGPADTYALRAAVDDEDAIERLRRDRQSEIVGVFADPGIDGSRIPVAGGWAPTPGYVPGSSAPDHGTMVAFDVRIGAPDAQVFDYALLRSQAGAWAAFLSDAIAAFADLVERVNATPGRWVVNNSWGL